MWKCGIREAPHGNCNSFWLPLWLPEDRTSTLSTEMENHLETAFCQTRVRRRFALDLNGISGEKRGYPERTAGSPLALQTATKRYRKRLALAFDRQLFASAHCSPVLH